MNKKTLIIFFKVIISISLVAFLFFKLGLKDIAHQFVAANLWWILSGITAFTLSNFLGAFQWHLLMKTKGIHLPFHKVLSYYYVGLFFNNFLIGYVGGDAVRIYDISKASGDSTNAISTVFLDRFIGFFMLTTLALFAALLWNGIFNSQSLIISIIVIFCCWIISIIFLFNKKFTDKISWIIKAFLPIKIESKVREIYYNINSFKHAKKTLIIIVFISFMVQTLRVLVHFFAALSLGLHIHLKYFIIFIPIIALLVSIPISIGGIGVRESSAVALFSQVNAFQPEVIVTMEFLAYLSGLLSSSPGGLLFILRKEKISFL